MKLLTLNIECDRHLMNVLSLIKKREPDVVCLQEIYEDTAERIQRETGMERMVFMPMLHIVEKGEDPKMWRPGIWGMALFSNYPIRRSQREYYYKPEDEIQKWNPELYGDDDEMFNLLTSRGVIIADIIIKGQAFTTCTTHFTWSHYGKNTSFQQQTLNELIKILDWVGEYVICGDFNVPRGSELWGVLTEHMKDNMPKNIDTTLDPHLFRVPNLKTVVDGIFSITPPYFITGVKTIDGVSDHMALVAEVKREKEKKTLLDLLIQV